MANLYVNSATGNDSTTKANNTVNAPWETIGRALWGNANRGSPSASEAAAAGDTVIIKAGTYEQDGQELNYDPAFNPYNSGIDGNPITFKAEYIGAVTLSLTGTSTGPVFGAYQKNYITWDGFVSDENDHSRYTGEPCLAGAWTSTNIIFKNCKFIGMDLALDDKNHSAIRFEGGDSCTVQNCYFTGVTGTGENHSCVYLYISDDLLLEHNEVVDSNALCFIKGPTEGNNNNRTIVRYNLVSGCYDVNTQPGHGVRVGYAAIDAEVYQNIIINVWSGIQLTYQTGIANSGNIIANNTIHGCVAGINIHGAADSNIEQTVYNNIILSNTRSVASWAGAEPADHIFEHNIYYGHTAMWWDGSNQTWATWIGLGMDRVDPDGQNADPLVVSEASHDFRLQDGSPALGAGIDILDLDVDSATDDAINCGAYITGLEQIGMEKAGKILGTLSASIGKHLGVGINTLSKTDGMSLTRIS